MTDNSEANNTDTKEFATKFLNLWQKQLDVALRDPSAMEQTLNTLSILQKQYFNTFNNKAESNEKSRERSESRVPPAATSVYGDSSDELYQLKLRLSVIEERLAALELRISKRS